MILDATCGLRGFWKNRDLKNLVCLDRRSSVKPDIVADDRFLPFRESVFDAIYFDPPHNHGQGGFYKERYGGFGSYENLRELYRKGTKEFARCLRVGGLLVVKLTRLIQYHGSKHHESLIESQMDRRFSEYAQAAGLTLRVSRERASRGFSRTARVVWLTFRKQSVLA